MEQRQWSASDGVWLGILIVLVGALLLHKLMPRLGGGPGHDTYSVKAEGKRAFFMLVGHRGSRVHRTRSSLPVLCKQLHPGRYFDGQTLCILGPDNVPSREEWDAVFKWVRDGGSLIFAAREDEFVDQHTGFEIKIPEIKVTIRSVTENNADDGKIAKRAVPTIQELPMQGSEITWRSSGRIVTTSPTFLELVTAQDGSAQAVEFKYGRGTALICASDFVFSNQSLAYGDNSVFAYRLLENPGRPRFVVFDESLNSSGLASGTGLLMSPSFLPLTLQVLIGLVLFGWWRSHRFGPLLPREAQPRQNIVDHTDAIGNIYFRAHDAASALRLYLKQLVGELKLRSHKGREERVLAPIAARMGRDPQQLLKVLRAANELRRDPKLDRRTAAQLIRRLAQIRHAAQAEHRLESRLHV
ncbi:MAG: DUF4350 domain-containing protein [Planctomycetota bacterium]|nr:DUF4350 domain-containing protein [Planctomycetota bacterium]